MLVFGNGAVKSGINLKCLFSWPLSLMLGTGWTGLAEAAVAVTHPRSPVPAAHFHRSQRKASRLRLWTPSRRVVKKHRHCAIGVDCYMFEKGLLEVGRRPFAN